MQKPWQTGAHIGNLRLPFSLFFCFSKRKDWEKKTSPGGFRFPPESLEPTKKTAPVFLDLSREIWKTAQNFWHFS